MKNGVMAIVIFVAAFILTTAALIFLNTQFMNIFKFDFRGVHVARVESTDDSAVASDSTGIVENVPADSTQALDSLKTITQNLNPDKDSSKVVDNKNSKPDEKQTADSKTADNASGSQANTSNKPDEPLSAKQGFVSSESGKMDPKVYDKWKKDMAKIMEIMDSKKASQILRTYSDNIARDIFYTMKKKKAAEILSNYNVKTDSLMINKLTRMQ